MANLRCGNSKFNRVGKPDGNSEFNDKRSMKAHKHNPQRFGFDEGHLMYDKYGLPIDMSKTVIHELDS